ncbi:sulfatase-like hydrolase/transferase [Halioglobus sp.]|nr:sulfatase-like hydrolase/transferase [Halioglobus sp.]
MSRQMRLLTLLFLSLSLQVQAAPRPNVVLILTDDQSPIVERAPGHNDPHAFSPYGSEVLTPNIQQMAKQGIRFDRANVAITVCTPSRYNFLTGRFATRSLGAHFLELYPPGTISRPENMVELDPPGSQPNLPQLLQQAGYRTGFVGKSHMIRHELFRKPAETWPQAGLRTYPKDADPYDPKVSAALAHNHQQWQGWLKDYGFDFVDGVYPANLLELYMSANNHHHLEWTVSKALAFLETSRNESEPFFLYFATTIPHGPAPYRKEPSPYPFGLGGPSYPFGLDGDIRVTPEGILADDYDFMPSRDDIREMNAAAGLDDQLAYMTWFDAGVGAILNKLKDIGADDNTLVILASDHGAWRRGKATLYEGGMRIPLITRWPASKQQGRHYEGLISSVDVTPTILDLAGVEVTPGSLDGHSFRSVLEGSEATIQDAVFAEMGWARAIKTERWKYIAVRYPARVQNKINRGGKFNGGDNNLRIERPYLSVNASLGFFAAKHNPHYFASDQLFDLEADPLETQNVIAEHPEIAAQLQQRLAQWLQSFPDRPFGEFTAIPTNKPAP